MLLSCGGIVGLSQSFKVPTMKKMEQWVECVVKQEEMSALLNLNTYLRLRVLLEDFAVSRHRMALSEPRGRRVPSRTSEVTLIIVIMKPKYLYL